MVDNVAITPGSGADIAADEVASVFYQRVKAAFGPDGVAAQAVSLFRSIDLDETEEEVKATAGIVYWVHAVNLSTADRFVKLYNAPAASVTVGTTVPVMTIPLGYGSLDSSMASAVNLRIEADFDTGISIACTTGIADNDTGAPAANDVVVNVGYL